MTTNSTANLENGFLHSILSSFHDFRNFANYFSDDFGFVFRGHAQSDWKLETSLDRLIRRINPVQIDLETTYDFQLGLFVKSIRGRTGVAKDVISNKDELWALGQHYGLATPLLDWTSSLYVSLFFAFADPTTPPSGYRSVWALHRKGVIDAMTTYNEGRKYNQQFSFIDPLTDHNTRLVSQAGAFTRQPLNFDIQNWVQSQFKGAKEAYLFKVDVPDTERLLILRHLRQMNIHSGTLFPDLVGASLDCNETLEILADKHRRKAAAGQKEGANNSLNTDTPPTGGAPVS